MQELEQILAKILEKSLEIAEQTGKFVMDQAPDLLQEFYRWHITMHSFYILLGIIIILVGWNLPRIWGEKFSLEEASTYDVDYFWKIFGKYYKGEGQQEWLIFSWITGFIIGIPLITIHLYKLIFILVAPKIYLIEYFLK